LIRLDGGETRRAGLEKKKKKKDKSKRAGAPDRTKNRKRLSVIVVIVRGGRLPSSRRACPPPAGDPSASAPPPFENGPADEGVVSVVDGDGGAANGEGTTARRGVRRREAATRGRSMVFYAAAVRDCIRTLFVYSRARGVRCYYVVVVNDHALIITSLRVLAPPSPVVISLVSPPHLFSLF